MKTKTKGSVKDLLDYYQKTYESQKDRNRIRDFFDSSLEDSLMPKKKIWSYVKKVLDKSWAFSYSSPQGDEGLRMNLAERYLNNIKLADDFMVTSGAQEAFTIIIQYLSKLTKKNMRVGVEEFSYIGFRHVLAEQKCRIKYLKLSNEGVNINNLTKELKKGLDLIYVVPDLQNPTGVVYSEDNRRQLRKLQEKYNFWLIVDLSYRDLYFDEADMPGITMFNHKRTFLVGSFSKTMFPSLRVGWLYYPKMNNDLLLVRRSIDLFQPTFLQLAVSKYLNCDYSSHLDRVRTIMKDKKNLLIKELNENGFGKKFQWNDVQGGYYLWLRRIDGKSCQSDINKWANKGVIVASGVYFNLTSGSDYIRLCFARLDVNQIIQTIKRIGYLNRDNQRTGVSRKSRSRICVKVQVWLKDINNKYV